LDVHSVHEGAALATEVAAEWWYDQGAALAEQFTEFWR
jgi:hypothetical protein